MKPTIIDRAKTAQPYKHTYATTYATEDGLEFVLCGKSMDELSQAWAIVAGPVVPFDRRMVSEIRITKA